MYKEYMLKCECWNPLECTWESSEFIFRHRRRNEKIY